MSIISIFFLIPLTHQEDKVLRLRAAFKKKIFLLRCAHSDDYFTKILNWNSHRVRGTLKYINNSLKCEKWAVGVSAPWLSQKRRTPQSSPRFCPVHCSHKCLRVCAVRQQNTKDGNNMAGGEKKAWINVKWCWGGRITWCFFFVHQSACDQVLVPWRYELQAQ